MCSHFISEARLQRQLVAHGDESHRFVWRRLFDQRLKRECRCRREVSESNVGKMRPFREIDTEHHVQGWARRIDRQAAHHVSPAGSSPRNQVTAIRRERACSARSSSRRAAHDRFCLAAGPRRASVAASAGSSRLSYEIASECAATRAFNVASVGARGPE